MRLWARIPPSARIFVLPCPGCGKVCLVCFVSRLLRGRHLFRRWWLLFIFNFVAFCPCFPFYSLKMLCFFRALPVKLGSFLLGRGKTLSLLSTVSVLSSKGFAIVQFVDKDLWLDEELAYWRWKCFIGPWFFDLRNRSLNLKVWGS